MANDETVIDGTISPLYPDPLNRHFQMKTFSVDGVNYLDAPEEDVIPSQPDDLFVTVKAGEDFRLDLIAQRVYDNPELWWIIARANRIFNPFDELEPGITLRVPSRNAVFRGEGTLSG